MPEIKLTDVTKRWGGFYAVDHLDLDIEDNAFVTLLGPSGCGKTTTLRMIAGLETPTSGRITIGDKVVFDSELGINVPANKRKVGFLFQNYALWPNMTVYQNISFGLSNVKEELPKVNFEARVAAKLIDVLSDVDKLVTLIEECRDKKGNIDNAKAQLKLIDTYIISMFSAKKLLSYGFEKETDRNAKANAVISELKGVLEKAVAAAQKEGCTLNENYEYVKNGVVVTQKRKLSKEEIDLSVRRVSRIVKIGMFMDRYPAELSGGQQQRVAIARTLAPEPTVLFMDEPLSNLDAKLRLEMRSELQRLHLDTGSTFVYVTHDQMEAMTLATKICLIDNGVLQQYDAPLTVYGKPENTFVADFVGNPQINFIEAVGEPNENGIGLEVFNGETNLTFKADGLDLASWRSENKALDEKKEVERKLRIQDKKNVEKANKDTVFKCRIAKIDESEIEEDKPATDRDFVLGVRPEFIKIVPDGKIVGEVYSAMPTGMETTVRIKIGNLLLTGVIFGGITYSIGEKVRLSITGDDVMLFDKASGRLIATGSVDVE